MGETVSAETGDAAQPSRLEDVVEMVDADGELRSLSEIERDTILFAIRHYDGQMSEIARRLGIGRSTLYRKLKEFGIRPGGEGDKLAS
jgi:transcriptional regulator of acetoin/glycerol metabolism